MSIELTIVAADGADLYAQLRTMIEAFGKVQGPLTTADVAAVAEEVDTPTNGKARRGRPAKAKSVLDEDEGEADEAPPTPKEKPITKDALLKMLNDYMDAHSEPETAALLKKYGKASKVSQVDPERYAAVYAAAKAAME